ncbi:hypothetical protein [Fibrella forsythiae]|uniref:Copper chaperone n=1 Tax=Fibrella forsythiae TaxID=2817061 RepID=A0ABS3JFA6_9BACT|nr:hypothetical protein [Fibrella forsythiae]MBO0948118.1 hypothetical protein [Fibrella forsythiae]
MTVPLTHILVFRTTVQTEADKHCVSASLDAHEAILSWTIDLQDVDCVLRIVSATLAPASIIHLINKHGFACAELE